MRGKSKSTKEYIGCSDEYLKKYLEIKFERRYGEKFNWKNYVKNNQTKDWHIDHIIPLSAFDLTKEENIHRVMYYTNLEFRLWVENIQKGNKCPNH